MKNRQCLGPRPEILISLVWGAAQALKISRVPQAMLMSSHCEKAMAKLRIWFISWVLENGFKIVDQTVFRIYRFLDLSKRQMVEPACSHPGGPSTRWSSLIVLNSIGCAIKCEGFVWITLYSSAWKEEAVPHSTCYSTTFYCSVRIGCLNTYF